MTRKVNQFTDKELEDIARKKRNEYYRRYRKENKEKIAAINKRYWINKALKDKKEEDSKAAK